MPKHISTQPETQNLIRALFASLKERRIMLKTLAYDSGLESNNISRIKHGRQGVNLNTLVQLGKAAGLELHWKEKEK